jgi:hypothetical protein
MNKNAFLHSMNEGGDCYINYISPVSKKQKYHVGTTNFSPAISPYIAKKLASYVPPRMAENQVLVFCYDMDTFKPVDTSLVISVLATNKVIRQPDEQRF